MLINTFYIPVWCYELQSNMLHQGKFKLVFRSPQITDHIKAMNPTDLAQRNPSLK